jgi:hypothetical protein
MHEVCVHWLVVAKDLPEMRWRDDTGDADAMTVYAQSDVDSVTISGAGHSHVRTKNEDHMKVTCVTCEPELIKLGWVKDPRQIPLTFDEQRESEAAQRDIAQFERQKVAESAREAAAAVRSAGRTPGRGRSGATR